MLSLTKNGLDTLIRDSPAVYFFINGYLYLK